MGEIKLNKNKKSLGSRSSFTGLLFVQVHLNKWIITLGTPLGILFFKKIQSGNYSEQNGKFFQGSSKMIIFCDAYNNIPGLLEIKIIIGKLLWFKMANDSLDLLRFHFSWYVVFKNVSFSLWKLWQDKRKSKSLVK